MEEKKKSTPPNEWFTTFFSDKYSKFDDQGLPTHTKIVNKEGKEEDKEISKEIKNKLMKEQKKQEEVYNKWLQSQQLKEEGKTE